MRQALGTRVRSSRTAPRGRMRKGEAPAGTIQFILAPQEGVMVTADEKSATGNARPRYAIVVSHKEAGLYSAPRGRHLVGPAFPGR